MSSVIVRSRRSPENSENRPSGRSSRRSGTVAVDGQHDDRDDDHGGEHARRDGRRVKPADVRQPRLGDEEDQQDREHVIDALEQDGAHDLHRRRGGAVREHHDAHRFARAHGQDVVVEVADQHRVGDGADRRPAPAREQRAPAQRAGEHARRERHERGEDPPDVARAQRVPRQREVDAAEGDVGEDDGHHDHRDVQQQARAPCRAVGQRRARRGAVLALGLAGHYPRIIAQHLRQGNGWALRPRRGAPGAL